MAPYIRRKSQSAVIEHAPAPPKAAASTVPSSSQLSATAALSSFRRHSQLSEVVSPISDDDAAEVNQPKKRHWFQLRKPRRHSDGDDALPGDVESGGTGTGRSFVVLRGGPKSARPAASASGSGSLSRSGGADAPAAAKSFVVLRGKDAPA